MPETIIESLDNEGRGVARHDGKAIFIEGALPQERVVFSSYRRKPNYELATASRILAANALRVEPRCRHFGICGGCSMQHLGGPGQAAAKQRVLEDDLWHIGRMRPEVIFPAIHGPSWAYRTRARLSVRRVPKKGGVLVGFHEKRSSFIADMDSCEVLPLSVSALLPLLRTLIGALSISDRLPQIEVAVGDGVTVLVLRILQRLTPEDESLLRDFAEAQGVQFWLQQMHGTAQQHAVDAMVDLGEFVGPEFQPQAEIRQGIAERRCFDRMKRLGRLGTARLQPELHALRIGEIAQ